MTVGCRVVREWALEVHPRVVVGTGAWRTVPPGTNIYVALRHRSKRLTMEYVQAFQRTVDHFPNRVLVETFDAETYTYGEVDGRTDALAATLDDQLGDGRCAALLQNGLPAIESMLAGQKRGRANVQVSFRTTPKQLIHAIETADVEGLIVDDANAEVAAAALEDVAVETVYHVGEDPGPLPAVEAYESVVTEAVDYDVDNKEPAESAILFTSGTTGMPKAVPQNQKQAWLASSQTVMEHGFDPTDVGLVMTPWYHDVTTVAWILPHVQVGAKLVPQPAFDPEEALAAIERYEATGILAVPAQLRAMVGAQREAGFDLSSLNDIRTGGAVVPPELVPDVRETFDAEVHNTYGLTEGIASLTHAYPFEQDDNPGTVGTTSFVWEDVRAVEAADPPAEPDPEATVGPGETGELLAKGPSTDGYLDNPEATERLYVGDWLRTGDVARVNDAGGLHIVDRIDNMFVSGGENVYPQEVELVLGRHDAVEEVAVVGIPDDEWGQKVGAVVVRSDDVSEEELDAHCLESEDLEDFKRPRAYALTGEPFDRSETGTLNRSAIRDQYFG